MTEPAVCEAAKPIYENLTSWRDAIETTTKGLVVFVGLAYVIGLFVLNMHVRRYGMHYLGFLQIEYVMAGILWLFLTAVMFSWVLLNKKLLKDAWSIVIDKAWKDKGWKARASGMLALTIYAPFQLAVSLSIPAWILFIVSGGTVDFYSWEMIKILLYLLSGCIGIFNIVSEARKIFKKDGSSTGRSRADNFLFTFFYVALFFSGISRYSTNAFPKLASVFGGGSGQKLQFIIKKDNVDTISTLGWSVDQGSRLIGPFGVILESPDSFLLSMPETPDKDKKIKAVRLNKDIVEAVLYLTEK